MAYTNADTRAKVGFRPYHDTDPFGAAHLSGYGSGLGRPANPFLEENWVLHTREAGLGDYFYNRPFDPWELYSDTAPGLHGLGYLGAAPDPDTITELENSGWNPQDIEHLVALGATDEELLTLPYGPGTTPSEMHTAFVQLWSTLTALPRTPAAQQQAQQIQNVQTQQTYSDIRTTPFNVSAGNALSATSSGLSWLEANWPWLALAAGGLLFAGPVAQGLFGRRR